MLEVLNTLFLGLVLATIFYSIFVSAWLGLAVWAWRNAQSDVENKFWVSDIKDRVAMLQRLYAAGSNVKYAREAFSALHVLLLVLFILGLVVFTTSVIFR